ncbi:MAG TPA: tRNA pseudouridine(38-40) synthase TruA [Tahibacter sp.]|nr:tRNA pseudouridine(38-40) synthase TruA [Tahibacter sp.]
MRIALGVEYDGTDFLGWQRLSTGRTVQEALEDALSFVADAPVEVICAGRTDSGVHARCQVVHFDSDVVRAPRNWLLGANSRMPSSVCVRWAQVVADDFHARFAARARRYRYTILNRAARPALDARYVTWERVPLDVDAMQRASRALIGEHDFNAFRTVACQAPTSTRDMQAIDFSRDGDLVHVEVQANAFLHHMVRNIVGSLLPVGRGEMPVEWVGEVLAGLDRAKAGPTAPAQGLTFLRPLYPAAWGLPAEVSLP